MDASRGGVTACAGARVTWFKVCISKTDNKGGSSECGCDFVQQSKKSTESRIMVRFPALGKGYPTGALVESCSNKVDVGGIGRMCELRLQSTKQVHISKLVF